jgi:hypothetical protein
MNVCLEKHVNGMEGSLFQGTMTAYTWMDSRNYESRYDTLYSCETVSAHLQNTRLKPYCLTELARLRSYKRVRTYNEMKQVF